MGAVNLFVILAVGSVCLQMSTGLQCLDPAGKPVDWFIVYKIPKIGESSNPLVEKGLAHFYMDVNSPRWSLSKISMNDTGHAVYNTLKQIYSEEEGQNVFVMYNDEKPSGKRSDTHGHTKGVIGFDKTAGFWLVHSTPRFPPKQKASYDWPDSALDYGQSFLCVTYNYQSLDIIGTQFHYNYPLVYDYSLPDQYKADNVNLTRFLEDRKHTTEPPWTSLRQLTSKGGESFLSFAKFSDYDKDLYSSWIAPYFKSSLQTETWQNGVGKLPSNCTDIFKVFNIEKISLPEKVNFKETKDHSKWAITTANSPPWVCIGDINRQEHQMLRAGGTVCFKHQQVHDQFSKSVAAFEDCKSLYFNSP